MSVLPNVAARVRQFIELQRLFEKGDEVASVWVGFSGGADSTALLLLLRELGYKPLAVHLNHGLRGRASDADAAWCRQFCTARDIPFEDHKLCLNDSNGAGEGVEGAARQCRLAFWERRVGRSGVVALGHHMDDAVENMLLRLARGANATGLTGLRPVRRIGNVRYMRPLLCLRKAEIVAYLQAQGISDWRQDETNADTMFRRNAVRHAWLPLIRDTVGHDGGLTQTLANLRMDADFLEQEARQVLDAVDDPRSLRELHPALLPRALRAWFQQQTGRDIVLRGAALGRIREALEACSTEAAEIPLGGGDSLVLTTAGLRLKEAAPEWPPVSWTWRSNSVLTLETPGIELRALLADAAPDRQSLMEVGRNVEWFSTQDLPAILVVRSWRPGDRMVPFGRKSEKKLQDLFVDAHVPEEERSRRAVLEVSGTIVWIPGLRRAEFGRVAPGRGGTCVRLECRPLSRDLY